jgi:hypothetical protein
MATRIRYIKDGADGYVSARYITIKDGEARVSIEPHKKQGFVHINGRPDIRVVGTSLHKIKIALKNVLVSLGAEFTAEERGDEAGQE